MRTCACVLVCVPVCVCVSLWVMWLLGKQPMVYDVKPCQPATNACLVRLFFFVAWDHSRLADTDKSVSSTALLSISLSPYFLMSWPSVDVSFNKCSQCDISSSAPILPLHVDSLLCVCVSLFFPSTVASLLSEQEWDSLWLLLREAPFAVYTSKSIPDFKAGWRWTQEVTGCGWQSGMCSTDDPAQHDQPEWCNTNIGYSVHTHTRVFDWVCQFDWPLAWRFLSVSNFETKVCHRFLK